jgi:hypothetical protein
MSRFWDMGKHVSMLRADSEMLWTNELSLKG